MISPLRSTRHFLLILFVLSGFAGLIYQSIWSHYLGLFLGHAAYAQALVLAIFMGGMAIGATWAAHSSSKKNNLIRLYAIVETIIGVFALSFHFFFQFTLDASHTWLIPSLDTPWAINISRWFVASMLILPQTILLGMTFPLMSGGMIRQFPGNDGNLIGGLYFANSIGAAVGALAAVFLFLPSFGLPGTMNFAGGINFLVAALAWFLSSGLEEKNQPKMEHIETPDKTIKNNPLLRLVLFGTAFSGAASFIYEIVWIRMLSMAVGSTMHAFELMLASFIAGIALGGLWIRKHADQTKEPLRLVGWMQIFMGIAALASLAVYANAFSWVGWLIGALSKTDGGYAIYNFGTASIAILIMLPAAFFAGTTLPLFTIALLRNHHGEGAIGRVYAWNTFGAIAGVFLAIHFLIPALGLKFALCIAALIDLLIGLFLLRAHGDDKKTIVRFALAASISAIALIVAVRIPYDPMKLASGVFRYGDSTIDATTQKVVYYRDGKTSSISVVAGIDGSANISTNGKPDAGIMMKDNSPPTSDESTMVMLAAVPLTMLDKPANIGVIGFGSGMTTHTLLGDPRVKHVDTIEIEPAMVEGARLFGARVERAYTDPRSHIVIDDAKAFFSSSAKKYDLIISEPSNPWISGVGSLFSKEFYKFIPKQLNEGGIFAQWVQLYEIDEQLVGSILNAMAPHFDDYAAWLSNSSDLIIVASPKGKLPNTELKKLFSETAPLKSELQRIGISTQEHLDFRKIANSKLLRGMAAMYSSFPANSDYHPILGLHAPKSRFRHTQADAISTLPAHEAPILEALDVRSTLPIELTPSKLQHFIPDIMTWRARALANQLEGKDGRSIAPDLISNKALNPAVLLKSAASQACDRSWGLAEQNHLSLQIREFSDVTLAFLPPSAQQNIWKSPRWIPCKNLPEDFSRAFLLLSSIGDRNWNAMQESGTNWFSNPVSNPALRNDFSDIALSAILLGLAHEKRWADLLEAEKKYGSLVKSNDVRALHRNLLKAIASQ